jgi:DNA invertase Pin-like site-specific DNA recombinase
MSNVYSYVRFSSQAQEFGDSQRRQFTRAQEYCRKNNLTLETTTLEDLGVSAWRGRNVDKGQLGVLLKAVHSGLIASDSTLLVEHLDRVTREKPTQAHELETPEAARVTPAGR